MDDLVLITIGKLYLELTNFQRIIEAQRARITELENQATLAPPKSSSKDSR